MLYLAGAHEIVIVREPNKLSCLSEWYFLVCHLANLLNHSGSVMAWHRLGIITSLAGVHGKQVTHLCVCVFGPFQKLTSNSFSQNYTVLGWLQKWPFLDTGFYYHQPWQNLLNQDAIRNGFHYEELSFRINVFLFLFFVSLNQNGNEEWWPSIPCLNQLKQAQFVVL